MRATQICAYLAAPAFAAALGLSANMAFGDAVSPEGSFTASASNVTFTLGTATMTFSGSSFTGNAQSSPSGQPICGPISPPTFFNGTMRSAGITFPVACSTSRINGDWTLCISSSGAASLTIPKDGIICTASLSGQSCTMSFAPSAAVTIRGTWSITTGVVALNNSSIPVATFGGVLCPSVTSSPLTASYNLNPPLTTTPN